MINFYAMGYSSLRFKIACRPKYERFRAVLKRGMEWSMKTAKGMLPELRSTFPLQNYTPVASVKGKGFALPSVALDTSFFFT